MPLFGRLVLGYWYPLEQLGGAKREKLQTFGNTYSPCELQLLTVDNRLLENYKWESPVCLSLC